MADDFDGLIEIRVGCFCGVLWVFGGDVGSGVSGGWDLSCFLFFLI